MTVLVHKAVEPANLSKAGKARLQRLLKEGGYWLMPKYDGVYVQFVLENGQYVPYTRTGERVLSVDADILQAVVGSGPIALAYPAPSRIIGELWGYGLTHAEINGRARRKTPQAQKLVVHDAVWDDHQTPYRGRFAYVEAAFPDGDLIRPATRWDGGAWGNMDAMDSLLWEARKWSGVTTSAYDGLILRDPEGMFVPGAGKDGEIIKIKPRQSGDFRVLGVVEGKGKASGMAGALILDLGGGVTCEVGTGLSDDQRKDYWDWWVGPSFGVSVVDSKPYPGRIAEIEYLSITKDGKLREPSFKSTRWDKTTADVLPGNIKSGD